MNEVEKMYENAGIKQLPTCNNCYMLVEYWSNGTYCSTCKDDKDNDECGIADYKYPPFTAEKQLELIKKLGNINIDIDNGCYMSSEILEVEAHCDTFEETLAEFVNNLWQDLTEEERKQIKEILE